MTALVVGLVTALGLMLIAVIALVISRRRIERRIARERAENDASALAARAELQERLALDVAAIVAPLRALLEDQARARAASAADVVQLVASLRLLVEWFAAFASAQYAQACASVEPAPDAGLEARGHGPPPPRPALDSSPTMPSRQANDRNDGAR